MAKKRSGLGRGLNSLIGESRVELGQEPAEKPKEPISEFSSIPGSPDSTEKPAASPESEKGKAQVMTTVTEEAAAAARIQERPARPPQASLQEIRAVSRAENALREAEMRGDVAKPVPYIEEDDHTTIKEVVVREKREIKQADEVDIDLVEPNPNQPRTNFKEEEIEELAASIERDGLLQPVLVRKVGMRYQIIAGERRWQACKRAGLKTIPIREREADDDKALELALIENIQRSDLNPIEEAYGYKRLMERNGMTQSDVAQVVSKGRSTIANALRLLELPEEAQQLLFEDKITAGHARAILSVPTPEGKRKLTEKLRNEKLSVRETEILARLFSGQAQNNANMKKRIPTPPSFKKCARQLRKRLNTKVSVKTVRGRNKIEIEFVDEEDLKRIFELMDH